MATKKVVVNKVFNQFASEFITQLFKPQWSPKRSDAIEAYNVTVEPKPIYSTQVNNHQPLFTFRTRSNYTGANQDLYKSDVFQDASNAFIVTEDFFIFMDLLFAELDAFDTKTFVHWQYNSDGSLNTAASFVDELAAKFPEQAEFEATAKGDARYRSQNLVEFLLRNLYSSNPDARALVITEFGARFGIDINATERAIQAIIPFKNYNPDDMEVTLQDDGLLTLNYPNPMELEYRFDKAVLNTAGLNIDKVYVMFPMIQAGLVSGEVPCYAHTYNSHIGAHNDPAHATIPVDYNLNCPHWSDSFYSASASATAGKETFKSVMPYVALSLGSVEENADTSNVLAPYDIVTDHTDVLDYFDNLIFNINTPKRYK